MQNQNEQDDLEIPAFLKREPVKMKPGDTIDVALNKEVHAIMSMSDAPKPKRLTPAQKKAAEAQERGREIKKIAEKRWRFWRHGDVVNGQTTLQRPQLSTFFKEVEREWKAKGW